MSATDVAGGAERAIANLRETSVDLRACAILDPSGKRLASTADGAWERCVEELWDAATDPGQPAPSHVHVAIEEGEVFAARSAAGTAVAVAERFALASLMFCDLRAALRELEAPPGAAGEPG